MGLAGFDGQVQEILSLGSVAEAEFPGIPGRRWGTTLQAIEAAEMRDQVYFAIRPGIVPGIEPHHGRYLRVRLSANLPREVSLASARVAVSCRSGGRGDAMPVVL